MLIGNVKGQVAGGMRAPHHQLRKDVHGVPSQQTEREDAGTRLSCETRQSEPPPGCELDWLRVVWDTQSRCVYI